MSFYISTLLFILLLSASCSTISKKDCNKDMYTLGHSQGMAGSPKKYTDDIRSKCSNNETPIDLEAYEKGFFQGWMEYCLPNKAFELGKKSDRYFSFCPPERESYFRKSYLIGKHHAELKDVESDIIDKMNDIKNSINENAARLNDYSKLKAELEKVKREIQSLEVEASKNNFKFR